MLDGQPSASACVKRSASTVPSPLAMS
jgi:hypothetical protein